MKKSNLLLSLLMAVTFIAFTSSCEDEEPIIGGEDGIPVADGFYITQDGVEPVSISQLLDENVEDGLDSKDRADFYANYVHLTAGNYVVVNIEAKEITASYGGTSSSVTTEDADQCEALNYTVIAMEADGASFAVAESGLYKVTYDMTSSEIVLVPIKTLNYIGDGTSVGWAGTSNALIAGSFDGAAGTGSWQATEVTLRQGNLKFRYNCTWAIDRPDYSFFTNFGAQNAAPVNGDGTINLATGNDEQSVPISEVGGTFPDEGVYTIDVTWAEGEFTYMLTRTGNAEEINFDPLDYAWGIIGAATQGTSETSGWDGDKKLQYKKEGTTHYWFGIFPLEGGAADNMFKFRNDDGWSKQINTENSNITYLTETGVITEGPSDQVWLVADGASGFYYFEISTSDNGETWDITIDEGEFQLIGDGSPVGNWDAANGQAMTYNDDLASATGSGAFTTAGWKFIVNNSFNYNLGGALDGATALEYNNSVAEVSADGTYTVTITTADGGQTYTATAVQ